MVQHQMFSIMQKNNFSSLLHGDAAACKEEEAQLAKPGPGLKKGEAVKKKKAVLNLANPRLVNKPAASRD